MEKPELKQMQLIRPTAAAAILGVHVKTLARWRKDGKGPAWYHFRGGAMYDKSDLARWVESKRMEVDR